MCVPIGLYAVCFVVCQNFKIFELCVICTGADVNRSTANNDHTVLSLASAGGHVSVVQYLLIRGAEPSYCLRVSPIRYVDVLSLCQCFEYPVRLSYH